MLHPCIGRLEKHLLAVPALVAALDEETLCKRPGPGKWSKKEILGHLVDSGLYNLQRFTKIKITRAPLEIVPYPQEELVDVNAYQEQDIHVIIDLWKNLNWQILAIWKNYSDAELAIKVSDPKFENEGDLAWWIEDYTSHMEHHFKQIFGTLYPGQSVWLATSEIALKKLAKHDQPFVTLLEHGSMYVEYYQPEKVDLQTPHDQDELYVIDAGAGIFFNNGIRHYFKKGDVLFAPAGVEHRFEQFSDDFATWVIFYGPKGGEANMG